MNSINISGRLTRDPETNAPNGEWCVLSFDICNNEKSKKDQSGQYEKIPQFFKCKYWTKNPTHWLKQLLKGSLVCLSGELEQEKWTDKEGNNHSKVVVNVRSWPIVVPKQAPKAEEAPPWSGEKTPPLSNINKDDIPF